jgi:hypothetical protein
MSFTRLCVAVTCAHLKRTRFLSVATAASADWHSVESQLRAGLGTPQGVPECVTMHSPICLDVRSSPHLCVRNGTRSLALWIGQPPGLGKLRERTQAKVSRPGQTRSVPGSLPPGDQVKRWRQNQRRIQFSTSSPRSASTQRAITATQCNESPRPNSVETMWRRSGNQVEGVWRPAKGARRRQNF